MQEPIKNLLFSEKFQQLCLELIGENVDLFWSATADKPKEKGRNFLWHQDTGYDETPKSYITIWTAFDHVDENNGGLWAVPGSHLGQMHKHEFRKANESDYAGVFIAGSYQDSAKAQPLRLAPGDVVCMDSRLVHASFQNHSLRERTGLIAAFIKRFEYSAQDVRAIPEETEPFLRSGKPVLGPDY